MNRSPTHGGAGADAPRVRIRPIQQHTDERGTVFEPVDPGELAGQRNSHVVLTEPGGVRGNHVHRTATEILVVRGPVQVRYREAGEVQNVEVPPGDVVSFTMPPGVPHAIKNTGSEPSLLVAFRDTVHDPDQRDTERVELF